MEKENKGKRRFERSEGLATDDDTPPVGFWAVQHAEAKGDEWLTEHDDEDYDGR